MKLKLIALGKVKREAFQNLADEYERRIRHFHPFEVVELPDEKVNSKNDVPRILDKEAERIEKALKRDSHLIVLDEKESSGPASTSPGSWASSSSSRSRRSSS